MSLKCKQNQSVNNKRGVIVGLNSLPNILTVKQLAEFLQISNQTVLRAIKAERLKAFKVGKDWRIERNEVLKWIDIKNNCTK